jgi:adenosylhomocysteine nucleosidase
METGLICLIAAMPEEIKPLLRLAGPYKKERIDGFQAYRFTCGKEKVLLVRSGMGPENAVAATDTVIKEAKPSLIVNFGFCGAIVEDFKVGDIVVAHRILLNKGYLFSPQSGIDEETAKLLSRSLTDILADRDFNVHGGVFITVSEIRRKDEMSRIVPSWVRNPVLEMETAAAAMTASKNGTPFLAIRCVSDDAVEEFGFSIDELSDSGMRIRIGKVLLTVARRPWIIPQLLRLSKNSKKAGKNLALAVTSLLDDADELRMKRERPY